MLKGALRNSKPDLEEEIGKFRQETEHFVGEISSTKFSSGNPKKISSTEYGNFVNELPISLTN
uniref:Uncharacterized protein n=1 Tax=Romanomermis culicivorax TaxID=13658 RepID=A0A915IYJ4_ROMCU